MSEMNEEVMNGLSRQERDTVIEICNITMGAAASTLSVLLGQEVEMGMPQVETHDSVNAWQEPMAGEAKTLVVVQYTEGLKNATAFLMREEDARKMADMMLGSGSGASSGLSELQSGAIGELMNQMMNAAASSMASVIHETVEINNPDVSAFSEAALLEKLPGWAGQPLTLVKIPLKAGEAFAFEMVQLMNMVEAKAQVAHLMSLQPGSKTEEPADGPLHRVVMQDGEDSPQIQPAVLTAAAKSAAGGGEGGSMPGRNVDPVTVRPVEFSSFDSQPMVFGEENKNLALVMDVTLSLTVELGKTEVTIKDVLELTRGSVIELDRVAGEPVDLLANGKLIAKGEVVVIEDNFGLRITSIVSPADRLRGL